MEEKSEMQALPCTKKFYQKLSAEISKLSSAKKISNFLTEETKCRKLDRKSAITKKLDQAVWRELRESVRKIIENDASIQNDKKVLKNLRQMIIAWILFPNLKGQKPPKWKNIIFMLTEA
jgi:hypothetical protein